VLQVSWLLLALLQDQPGNRHIRQFRDACEHAALMGGVVSSSSSSSSGGSGGSGNGSGVSVITSSIHSIGISSNERSKEVTLGLVGLAASNHGLLSMLNYWPNP
jgi:hypothetical protein